MQHTVTQILAEAATVEGSESSAHPETRTITASGGLKTCRRSHTWRRFDFGVLRDF